MCSSDLGQRRIRPSEWPDPAFVDVGIRGDLSEMAGARYEEQATFTGALEEQTFVDIIARTFARRMETDDRIVIMGAGGGARAQCAEEFPA